MSRKLVLFAVILAGMATQADAQCGNRLRSRHARVYYPAQRCWSAPAHRIACNPGIATTPVTGKRFGYRAPFDYGYESRYRATTSPTVTMRLKPTPSDRSIAAVRRATPAPKAPEGGPVAPKDPPPMAGGAVAEVPAAGDETQDDGNATETEQVKAENDNEPMSIVLTAKAKGNFSRLLEYAEKANLLEEVSGGPFTIFAPTDEAFGKLDTQVLQRLNDDLAFLRQVLRHHAVPTEYTEAQLAEMQQVSPFSGNELKLERSGETLLVDGVPVETPDVKCTDGTVHIIGQVLLPAESATEEPQEGEVPQD